jgi:hypothetical protein
LGDSLRGMSVGMFGVVDATWVKGKFLGEWMFVLGPAFYYNVWQGRVHPGDRVCKGTSVFPVPPISKSSPHKLGHEGSTVASPGFDAICDHGH